jgi:hypothetical protein
MPVEVAVVAPFAAYDPVYLYGPHAQLGFAFGAQDAPDFLQGQKAPALGVQEALDRERTPASGREKSSRACSEIGIAHAVPSHSRT